MYVSIREFEQDVYTYMQLAKDVDLFIVDSSRTIVWSLRRVRDPLLFSILKFIRELIEPECLPGHLAKERSKGDSFHPEC